jgi:hypothetical protein
MKKLLKQISLFVLPVFISAILLFSINPEKQFSYYFVKGECSNKASWIHDRVFLSDKKLDVVFIGASQTACAVKDELIEQRLNEKTGKVIKVASLGYCRGGRDIQYSMLKDIFREKEPRLVIIEVTEDEPKKSHPVFPYLAESKDIIASHVFFNQRYIESLWKGLILRFEYLKMVFFGLPELIGDSAVDHGYIPTHTTADEALLMNNRMNWERRLKNKKSSLLRSIEIRYSKHYLEEITAMAESNGCSIVFLYLRESGSGLKLPMLYDYYRSVADVIVLPDSIFSTSHYWFDATHLNDTGATIASEKIASDVEKLIILPFSEK